MNECVWTEDAYPDGEVVWETGCGETFVINDGTPEQNHFRFCTYCGKPLKQVEHQPEKE